MKFNEIIKFKKMQTILYSKLPKFFDFILSRRYHNISKFKIELFDVYFYLSTEDSYSKSWIFKRCDFGKIHEQFATELMAKRIKKSNCFVDIGAHLGYFTFLASKLIPNGKIYSFEMDKINYNILYKNFQINDSKNVEIYNAAVTEKTGELQYFRQSEEPLPTLNLLGENTKDFEKKKIIVKTYSLDDFFKNKCNQPDVIKIDVEGGEMSVLKGMTSILENKDVVLFLEIHPKILENFKTSAKKIISFLLDRNFLIFEIKNLRKEKNAFFKKLDINSKILENSMLYIYKK